MNTKTMLSSASNEWETPQDLFDRLNNKHHFNLDPASTDENAKCSMHFTEAENGLAQDWGGYTVWLNPPYGRELPKWIQKAYEESRKPGTKVVMLIPARTDTRWFHDYCVKGKIQFLKGRLKFGKSKNSAPFPSMIVVFEKKEEPDNV